MTEFAQNVNFILSLLTIGMQIVSVLLLIGMATNSKHLEHIRVHGVPIALMVAGGGTLLSLVYSNIIGFPACSLCLIQRAFLYPQVALFAFALWKRSHVPVQASLALSVMGGGVAAYHYYGQSFNNSILTCATGMSVSCAQRYFVEFGYITLPLMSLTTFIFLIEVLLIKHWATNKE